MIDKLKEKVEIILKNVSRSREDDQYLTLCIWVKYYPEFLFKNELGEYCVKLSDTLKIPKQDNVKRIRAKFNSQGLYLPTNPNVIKKRKILDKQWKQDLGYNI